MATEDARNYVLAFENSKPEAAQIAKGTAEKLQDKRITFIEVVEALGEYINDENEKTRARAINYLTAVISALPDKFLSRQQIQVLNDFLTQRIEDGGAVEGLSRLQALDRFNSEMSQTLVRALFLHFDDLRSRPQSARYRVLTLLNDMLNGHRKAVRDMGQEALTGIVTLVAGEKDPRNLMLVFSMLRVVMIEWDVSNHVDMLFDAVYAYFPITFRPPPNDPYGITAQDLKDRLKDCLSSTGALAPQTFPNLLDRLDSTSDTVKKDVLQALAACASNYDVSTLSRYSITLWDAVKFEVLQAQEPFLADEALTLLTSLATSLSNSSNSSPTASPLVQYLKPVTKECLEHLQEPASRQAKASGDILKAVASASTRSFEYVVKNVGPKLFSLYRSADSSVSRRAILEVTNKIFEACIEVFGSWRVASVKNASGMESLLHEMKDELLGIYGQALMGTVKEEVSFRLTAARGLLLLSQMRSFLADNEIGLFVQYFDEIVLDEESYGRDELKKTAMTALADISTSKPRLITDITFPAFLARLPDDEDQAERAPDYRAVLEGLAQISVGKDLLETLTRRLLNKLEMLFQSPARPRYPYVCAILSTLHYVLDRSTRDPPASLDEYYDRVVVELVRQSATTTTAALANYSVLDLLGRIANLITRFSLPVRQFKSAENVYLLFRDPATMTLMSGTPVIFEPAATAIVSTWLLAALPRDMTADILAPTTVVQSIGSLATFAGTCPDQAVFFSVLRQIALLTNKHLPTTLTSAAEDLLSASYTSLIAARDPRQVDALLHLVFAMTKALVLRLASNTTKYLTDLVSLLDAEKYTHEVAATAAMGFGDLLASDDILSKQNHAQIRLLAPQRIFQTLVPLFATNFRSATLPASKQYYLTALAGVLGTVASDIVIPELPTLLPLLLQSLDLHDQRAKTATLSTLAVVVTRNPAALQESGHIPSFIKRLLATASSKETPVGVTAAATKSGTRPDEGPAHTNNPQVRSMAAKCLTLLPKHVTAAASGSGMNPLLASKREVLQGLTKVLDDPRRDVRKEAVDARAAWLRGVDDLDSDEDED